MYKAIVSLSLVLFASVLIANETDNLTELSEKYSIYRQRVLDEWILISPNVEQFGVNIPAVDRRINANGKPKWLSWSDGNSNFNHWLSILALEYHLLKINKQDYTESLSILLYSFLALERLDLYSEYALRRHHNIYTIDENDTIYKIDYPNDINGFMLRDDVSLGFWRQYSKHFESEYGKHNKTKDGTNTYLSVFQKGVIAKQGMSQDNIIYMIQALAIVKHLADIEDISTIELKFINNYIPNYLKSKGIINNNQVDFGKWVDDLTDRLVRRMQNEYPYSKIALKPLKGRARPYPTNMGSIKSSRWYIMNPVTNDLVAEGNGEDMGVWMNSHGVGEAANYITGKDIYHMDGSDKGMSAYLFKAVLFKNFKFLKFGGFPAPEPVDDYMFRALASVADINWNKDSYDLLYLLGDKREKWTYEHNPLVLVLLHKNKYDKIYKPGNEFYDSDKKYYEELLGFAPISGPSTDFTRPDYHPYWSTSSRLNWPNNRGNRSAKDVWEYVGMDFMFLYNLYRIVFEPQNYYLSEESIKPSKNRAFENYPVPNLEGEDAEFNYLPPNMEE